MNRAILILSKILFFLTLSLSLVNASKEDLDKALTWFRLNGLNEYGDDPKYTMYVGGNPLFDMSTGTMIAHYDYLNTKFPHQPWVEEYTIMTDELAEADVWLTSETLNVFGDHPDTKYKDVGTGTPLYDVDKKVTVDRYTFLTAKYSDDLPWAPEDETNQPSTSPTWVPEDETPQTTTSAVGSLLPCSKLITFLQSSVVVVAASFWLQ